MNQLDAVIAIAPAIEDELLEYGVSSDRIARIPNGVDIQLYQPRQDDAERRSLREEFGRLDLPTVLFAGGINRRKQPQLLIEALGKLSSSGSELQLVLAGPIDDPELAEQMKQRADAFRAYLNSPRLCDEHGRAARQKVVGQFAVDKVLDAHERLFRAVRSGQAPASVSIL